MKVSKPASLQENFKQINPPNYQNYRQASAPLPPINKENKRYFFFFQKNHGTTIISNFFLRKNQHPNQKDEITHDNLMNFLSKKFTQLAPIEEDPNQSKKEMRKINENKQNQNPPQTFTRAPSEPKMKNPTRKLKSASSQQMFNNAGGSTNEYSPRNDSNLDDRDFLWDNNYKIKIMINQFKDDNSKLKAKIGNLEVFSLFFFSY